MERLISDETGWMVGEMFELILVSSYSKVYGRKFVRQSSTPPETHRTSRTDDLHRSTDGRITYRWAFYFIYVGNIFTTMGAFHC